MIRTIWTFPGQLTEYVGMTGSGMLEGSLALERNLAIASELVGRDLAALCREGPHEALRGDTCAAAAVVAVGAAAAEELGRAGFSPDGVLGYSLGLYTAAVAAQAISVEAALRLVVAIARAGERCFAGAGMAMGFVTGLKVKTLESEIGDLLGAGEVAITNVNSQAQIVLAGRESALEAAFERVRAKAIRCERLRIGRPYHCGWMAPVAEAVAPMCQDLDVSTPRFPLFDHRDGGRLDSPGLLRERLAGQLTSRLDWNATVGRLVSEGASVFVEMPPGSSTTRMIRWIARDATCLALDDPADRQRVLAQMEFRGHAAR